MTVTLTKRDMNKLKNAGFIDVEIKALNEAVDPAGNPQKINLGDWSWRSAIQSRKDWVKGRKQKGWSPRRIHDSLAYFYRIDKERSPFIFIQEEYRLGMTGKKISDYQNARARKAESKVKRSFKGYKTQRAKA